jgi:hypothetical protein
MADETRGYRDNVRGRGYGDFLGSALPWKTNLPEFLKEHKQIHIRKLNLHVLGFPEIFEGT